MEGDGCSPPPLTVEGNWSLTQTKSIRNKLELYFQSRRKSGGGDCRVEAESGAPRAAVFFTSEDVRERVLAKKHHEITVDGQTFVLRLISAASSVSSNNNAPDVDSQSQTSEVEPEDTAAAANDDEISATSVDVHQGAGYDGHDSAAAQTSGCSVAVVLENVMDNVCRDLLQILVENISGADESAFYLEIIWELNRAVVTFDRAADAERFLTVSQTSGKMQKQGLTVRPLEAAKSVRVENLSEHAIKDMLELYFEKNWATPINITMIPNELAATVTFSDTKVVEKICTQRDYRIGSIPVKMYPYHDSLGTALYGKERPAWKLPESFTENIHYAIWKFLLMKKQLKHINDHMSQFYCSVELDKPEVKLSPLPSLLRRSNLTAADIDNWKNIAQDSFCKQMSQYLAFECEVNAPAWKAAEKDVRSVVREDAVLLMDTSKGVLTVAGRAQDIRRIKPSVENIVLKVMSQIERQMNGVSDKMIMSPAMFYILKQDGLQKAAFDIAPELNLSYDEVTQALTIHGLGVEVYQIKAWILERNVAMSKKQLEVSPYLRDFLNMVDHMDMSSDLFTSQGISAIYSINNQGVLLTGSSDSILNDAERKIKMVLKTVTLDVEDQEVLKLPSWIDLNRQLLDSCNSSKKKTVAIQTHQDRSKITVSGFENPVNEVSCSLREHITNYSRVQETLRVESCAVVQFIDKKKRQDLSRITKANDVKVYYDPDRPRITIAGARLHVQKAKSSLQELASALFTENFIVDKPGAKKYFQSYAGMILSTIMNDLNCVVVLCPENQDEEDEENYEEESCLCYCKVRTTSGVVVSVRRADICTVSVDAVVNAANEDLQHIGGLALAVLKAAGPQLQTISNNYISQNGRLRPGDAVVTDAGNMPCKYIVHAVGPRYSDSDKRTAVSRLKMAVRESLRQAEKVKCSTIALPAISSGVFGFPVYLCAETIAKAVREYCDGQQGLGLLTEIHLVDNNNTTVEIVARAVNQEFSDLRPTMTVPQQERRKVTGATGGKQWGRGRGRGQSWSPSKGRWSGERGGKEGGKGGRGGGFHGGMQGNRGGHSPRAQKTRGHEGSGKMEQTTTEGLRIVLCKGNIQEQTTDVIVNTISESMNLSQGAVSKAILDVAGPKLQLAVRNEAKAPTLQYGDVVITDGFKLVCQKVFHVVCPFWDNRGGQAEETLKSIIRQCLEEAERYKMMSLSFPAIGTGNLSFPRDMVSQVFLKEIHSYSHKRKPRHLKEVAIVVHPSDVQTVDCFTREFKGQTGQRNVRHGAQDFEKSTAQPTVSQSQQTSAFSRVSSPSLGVYQMKMGQLTLEVSSGDITKETSDAIVNCSNQNFDLKAGVSKAILDGAGLVVELECSQIVSSPSYQSSAMILTSAGQLPSAHIIHIVGVNDPVKIREMVLLVLKVCEENKFSSVSFPALGTGQGGADPSAVADAMVDAVVEFVRKKHSRFVQTVKILIFQTAMIAEFHKSMKKREGQELQEKSLLAKFKDTVTSFFMGYTEEQPSAADLVLEREEFEPTVLQLCADNEKAVSRAKIKIQDMIVAEQTQKTIKDSYISYLSQGDMEELKALMRKLTVSITLDRGLEDQEPKIHLEGLTRDVLSAESEIRDIIRKVERAENLKGRAKMMSALVEWQYLHPSGKMVPFDIHTNLTLEEAWQKKQNVRIEINNRKYDADVRFGKAVSLQGQNDVELLRKDLKDDSGLPAHWEDMKGDIVKLVPLVQGSKEYNDVQHELTKTGLTVTILTIERVQNTTLWQSYQLLKKQMEVKNKHTNNEKLLFHGTGANSIDLINKQGFNRSYAGTHGAMHGNGSYFALDPAYSANGYAKPDQQRHKRMYQARVLVGDHTQGRQGIITPPSKNTGNAADLYDSVVNNTANPTIFVIFNDIQAYPEYLITFM